MKSTITEKLTDKLLLYKQRQINKIDSVIIDETNPSNISKQRLIPFGRDILDSSYTKLSLILIDKCNEDVKEEFLRPYLKKVNDEKAEAEEVQRKATREIEALTRERESNIQQKKDIAEDHYKSLVAGVNDLVTRQKGLSADKDRIREIMTLYNLKPDAFEISNDIDRKSAMKLYAIGEYGIKHTIKEGSLVEKLLSWMYYPIKEGVSDKYTEGYMKWVHFAMLIILVVLLGDYFLAGVSVVFITVLLGRIIKVRDLQSALNIAYALTQDLDHISPLKSNPEYLGLLADMQALVDDTETIRIQTEEIDTKAKEAMIQIFSTTSKQDLAEATEAYTELEAELDAMREKVYNECVEYRKSKLSQLQILIDKYREYIQALSAETKFLGDEIVSQRTMMNSIRVGAYKANNVPIYEGTYEIPIKNIAFRYETSEDRKNMIKFIKVLMINYLTNVREKSLDVTVYDSEDLGRDFAEFQLTNPDKLFTFLTKDFNKMIETTFIPHIKESIAKTGERSLEEFNKEADELGKITIHYKLLIILSTDDDPDMAINHELNKLMDYSAKHGVIIWTLNKAVETADGRVKEMLDTFYNSDIGVCDDPWIIDYGDNQIFKPSEPDMELYTYNQKMGENYLETMQQTLDENRMDILYYKEGYRDKYIPPNKVWTKSTRKGIDLRLGLLDGDPDKPYTVRLGDDAVHSLMAGATGSGKSATINFVLANLLHDYPPEELELVMIDFKNVEFAMYSGALAIPHAKVISGTKDGEYAISIFDYLMGEMERRTKLFEANKVQKLEEYNDLMESRGLMHEILPRILLLVDEFQVMFTEVDPKATEIIKGKITSLSKLARFCGCHMWFTSQSMSGTVSKDILDQFKLRMALSCSSDTSSALIGDATAARLPKKGFIISNDTAGEDPSVSKKWRVPFIPNSFIKEYLPELIKKADEGNHINRRPPFFKEDEVHAGKEIQDFYNKHEELKDTSGLFVLGARAEYSLNTAPHNIILLRDNQENILAGAFERKALLDLANTLITNIRSRNNTTLMVNCADTDTRNLLGLENKVEEGMKDFISPETSIYDILDFLEMNISHRKENEDKIDGMKELYVMLINYEKVDGFGKNSDYGIHDRMKECASIGPQYKVHIVIVMQNIAELRPIISAFNHKILAYSTDKESNMMLDNSKANKLNPIIAVYAYASQQTKFKLYEFPLEGELARREVVIA